jgi:hypothetical protein
MQMFVLVAVGLTAALAIIYFLFEVSMFRFSCRVAKVRLPAPLRVLSVVFVSIVIGLVTASVLAGLIERVYTLGGFPIWEASLVGVFVELPVHMVLVSAMHARMTGIGFRDALSVWFVEKLIKLVMLTAFGGVLVLAALAWKMFVG